MVARAARKMTPICRSEARGFTLLEVLIVLAILGMAASLVVPNLSGIGARRFDAQLREVAGLLNHARRMAVIEGHVTEVLLSVAADADSGPQAERGDRVSRYRFSAGMTLAWGEVPGERPEAEADITLRFFPEGGATGGDVVLRDAGREAVIRVDAFSGRVSTGAREEMP